MAQQFECVADGCDFTARGNTEDEVMEQVEQHRQENHPNMDVSEDEVRQNIHAV